MGNSPTADNQDSGRQDSARTEQNLIYLRQMLGELRSVADREKEAMLAYLIEMAFLEAGDALERRRYAEERARG